MIVYSIHPVKENNFLTTVYYQVETNPVKQENRVLTATRLLNSQDEAYRYINRTIKKWVTEQVNSFCNQREHALNGPEVVNALYHIRKCVNPKNSLIQIFTAILSNKRHFNVLMPHPNSSQQCWIHIINFLFSYAQKYLSNINHA